MADINLKTETPDTTLPTTGFLFGADSQAAASPSVYTTQAVATTLLGSTTLSGATITADAPVLDMSQTWNNGAVTFTGLKFNAATGSSAGSAAASLLMDLRLEGVSQFNVSKIGALTALTSVNSSVGNFSGYVVTPTILVSTSNPTIAFGGSSDAIISRRAAANLRFGAADAAGSAISISSVASNQLTLASNHGLTSGAAVIITGTTAPSGTSLNTLYYARSISAAVLELYLTFDAATATSGTTGIVAVTTAGTSASIRLATPFQRLSPQDFTGTDIPGQPLLINGSRGTGTGPGGSIIFQVAPAGGSGAVQNTPVDALTINSTLGVSIASSGSSAVSSGAGFSSLSTAELSIYTSGTRNFSFGTSSLSLLGTTPHLFLQSGTGGHIVFDNVGSAQIHREGTGILGQRGSPAYSTGTQAQAFRVYNTYTDATTFERANIFWDSNVLKIGTEKGSVGGTARALEFQTDGTTKLTISTTGLVTVNNGNLILGVSGILLTKYINNGDNSLSMFEFVANTTGTATFAVGGSAPLLRFGGITPSFPALKRSSTTLQARLADDTAFASVQGKLTTDTAYTATTIVPTGYLTLYDSTGTAYRVPCVV